MSQKRNILLSKYSPKSTGITKFLNNISSRKREIMKTIDLHIHTTASDGSFSPKELVDYAIKKNLSAVAITDHDTMSGIQEALDYIEDSNLPLELIPGMEVSTNAPDQPFGIHILAYFIDKSAVEREDILNNLEVELHRSSGSPQEAIAIIAQYGGLSSLAHPQDYCLSMNRLDDLIGNLAECGLNGIEAIYTTHSSSYISDIKKIASKYNLIITGGTDFHGTRKPGVDLGSGFGDMVIPYEIVNSLKGKTVLN